VPDEAKLTSVLGNPFEGRPYQLTPVDHDPFADMMSYAKSLPDEVPTPVMSGSILPFTRYSDGSVRFNSNAGIVGAIKSAVSLPGDVLTGKTDPNSMEAIQRSASLAGLSVFPALEEGVEPYATLASKSPRMYNPPSVPMRPFEADYPAGGVADETGKLLSDIEGRPLGAKYIAGRNMVGGGEEALSPTQSYEVGAHLSGSLPVAVAPRAIGGDAGRLVRTINPETGLPEYQIFLNKNLSKQQADLVSAHELAHAIDQLAGQIPSAGLNDELRGVYNNLNNPQNYGKPFGPENNGYKGANIQRELMAEAIRAYMKSPTYLKTVAPKTAGAIRAAVNSNPRLSNTIQFNSMGVPVTLSTVQHNPFASPP